MKNRTDEILRLSKKYYKLIATENLTALECLLLAETLKLALYTNTIPRLLK